MVADAKEYIASETSSVWATTWIAPVLGLPDLPVIELGEQRWLQARLDCNDSFKTHHLAAWTRRFAPGFPWAWVDDQRQQPTQPSMVTPGTRTRRATVPHHARQRPRRTRR